MVMSVRATDLVRDFVTSVISSYITEAEWSHPYIFNKNPLNSNSNMSFLTRTKNTQRPLHQKKSEW